MQQEACCTPERESFPFCDPVAHTDLCEEIFGFCGIFLNFTADIGHVDPEDLIIPAGPRPPKLLHDEVIGEDLAGVLTQKSHNAEFAESQMDVFSPHEHLVLVIVNGEIPHRIRAVAGDLIVPGSCAGVADGSSSSVPNGLVR